MKKITKLLLSGIFIILVLLICETKSNAYNYFETSKYRVTEGENKILSNLDAKDLKAETVLKNVKAINENYIVKAYDSKFTELTGKKLVGTGSILRVVNSQYNYYIDDMNVVVYGDIDGDGKINSKDALAIVKNKLGKVPFANEYSLEAGRITEKTRKSNSVPSSADALAIVKYKLGKAEIEQFRFIPITVKSYDDLYSGLTQGNTNFIFENKKVEEEYKKLQNIVSTYCTDLMSQTTKALVLHDYLVANSKLNYETREVKKDDDESNICNIGKTMNQLGFANSYTSLLGIAGIKSKVRRDKYSNYQHNAINEVIIDNEPYFVSCSADSYISEVEGKGKIRRYFFLRNTKQLEQTFWEDTAYFSYSPSNASNSTSTKYVGATWPEYKQDLKYTNNQIKLAKGKKVIASSSELKSSLLNGEDYIIGVTDSSTEELYEIDTRCKRIIKKYIKPEMTIEEKLLTIHDYICSNFIRNDHTYIGERKISNKEYDCAWGSYKSTILSNMGDCWTITNYFNTLCAYIGVETKSVTQHQIPNGFGLGNHMWSLVKLDGNWYHVDCEGGDYYEYGRVDRTWFLYSDIAMRTTENNYEPCTSTKYDGYKWPEFKGVEYYQDLTGIIDEDIPATDIGLKKSIKVSVGEKINLMVRVFPYGSNSKVNYTSSNKNIATVDNKGNVEILAVGKVKITVKTGNITKVVDIETYAIPEDIKIEEVNLKIGETKKIKYTVIPENAVYENAKWSISSSGESIASVDENGNITGLSEGTTYVYLNYEYRDSKVHTYTGSYAKVTVTK